METAWGEEMGFLFRTDEYKRLISELKATGDVEKLVDALDMIPDVISELVQQELVRINAQQDELSGYVREVKSLVEKIADSLMELNRKYSELNRRLSGIELTIGGLTEAILSRIIVDHLESMGYKIRSKRRNYRINEEDIDLLIVAEKDSVEEHLVVEIKVKPTHSDVGALMAKADLYKIKVGTRPRPILAGVWIGLEVEGYAKSKGVEIFRL